MTDKQLKQLLTPAPKQDEEFVRQVMNQLPQTTFNWRPVWGIRIVSFVVAVIALWSFRMESVSDFFYQLLSLMHQQPSFLLTLTGGLLVAVGTLWLCRKQDIV